MPELHSFMLSAAHTADDLSAISNAFKLSLTEMVNDGFFVE
jgi:glutamate-1-semialdehyde 2,1-aminomutase